MADKLDPFDVEALGNAVNDSATRVSTIWVSFLIFSLYLLIAATTVTQRQLLLADPLKLPVLNIDLPLWGFFFLAPILFVILHIYVLLQVLLLARTAAAYNAAVTRLGLSPDENISLRQRLANTLFAQIFAGSPREREGVVGGLLRVIVRITLAIAPILILLVFEFSFLAYHSHIATWTHRLLILIESGTFVLIWPLALNAKGNFQWPKFGVEIRQRRNEWLRLHQLAAPLVACLLAIFVSLFVATFPGEGHANFFTGQPLKSIQCERGLFHPFDRVYLPFDARFDRLVLPYIDVVDDDKLAKIVKNAAERNLPQNRGERTQNFRGRDFNCSDLSSGDLRRVDLKGARLVGADLHSATLGGAMLDNADLKGAILNEGQLQGASLDKAQLQGADLIGARLQGASLASARLQGANLGGAQLQAANLVGAYLAGASLDGASLQGASLQEAHLQAASLEYAQLQGASLSGSWLQGASLLRANVDHTLLVGVSAWRAKITACKAALVDADFKSVIPVLSEGDEIYEIDDVSATPDALRNFVDGSVARIVDAEEKEHIAKKMVERLVSSSAKDDAAYATTWRACEQAMENNFSQDKFNEEYAKLLRELLCNATEGRAAIAAYSSCLD